MAFKLALSTFSSGLEPQAIMAMCALRQFALIAPPITEAAMRANLEAGQFQAYSNAGWDVFLNFVGNLALDTSVLTAAERSIINTLYAAIDPAPQLACCGAVVPLNNGTDTSPFANMRTGSATFQHEVSVKLALGITCNIKSILVTLAGAIAVTTPQPFTMRYKECDVNEQAIFTKIWVAFESNPAASGTYNVTYNFLDANGVSITTFTELAQLTL